MKKCGDCIHADACEHNQNIPLFNSANEAYCKGFKDRTKYVEVVRCKDCKHFCKAGGLLDYDYCSQIYDCDGTHSEAYPDDFCSYGERRTNERKAD